MLRLTATVVALAGGGLLCIHWWISGNRGTAWLGAAILSLAITQVPSALLELDSSTAAAIATPPTVLDTLLAIPFLALLACGVTGRTFTHRITPIILAARVGWSSAPRGWSTPASTWRTGSTWRSCPSPPAPTAAALGASWSAS